MTDQPNLGEFDALADILASVLLVPARTDPLAAAGGEAASSQVIALDIDGVATIPMFSSIGAAEAWSGDQDVRFLELRGDQIVSLFRDGQQFAHNPGQDNFQLITPAGAAQALAMTRTEKPKIEAGQTLRLRAVAAVNGELKTAIMDVLAQNDGVVQSIYFALKDYHGEKKPEPVFGFLLVPGYRGAADHVIEYVASRIGAVPGMPESVLAIHLEEGSQMHRALAEAGQVFTGQPVNRSIGARLRRFFGA